MAGIWLAVLTSLSAAAAIIIGARVALGNSTTASSERRWVTWFAFGAGVLLVAVILDFLPDTWSLAGDWTPYGMFIGIAGLWFLTQWVDRAFTVYSASGQHREETAVNSTEIGSSSPHLSHEVQFTAATSVVLAISLSVHCLLEGTSLAVAGHDGTVIGYSFMLGILLHKLPEGVLWGLSLKSAMPNFIRERPNRIWHVLMIPAAFTILGTILGLIGYGLVPPVVLGLISALVCGALLFICLGELIPMLREAAQTVAVHWWFILGVVVMLIPIGLGAFMGH